MRGTPNYAVWTEPDGQIRERDGFTCGHCQMIVLVAPRQTLWGLLRQGDKDHCNTVNEVADSDVRKCPACQRYVCGRCAAAQRCYVWEKMIEHMESRERFVNSLLPESRPLMKDTFEYLEKRDAQLAEEEMRRRKDSAARSIGQ